MLSVGSYQIAQFVDFVRDYAAVDLDMNNICDVHRPMLQGLVHLSVELRLILGVRVSPLEIEELKIGGQSVLVYWSELQPDCENFPNTVHYKDENS